MPRLAATAAAAVTVVIAACSHSATTGAGEAAGSGGAVCRSAAPGAVAGVTVTIGGFKYAPQPVEAKVGDVIAWTNQDAAPHSATLDNGSCDTGSISIHQTAMLIFEAPGTYSYHCSVHPSQMRNFTIEVK